MQRRHFLNKTGLVSSSLLIGLSVPAALQAQLATFSLDKEEKQHLDAFLEDFNQSLLPPSSVRDNYRQVIDVVDYQKTSNADYRIVLKNKQQQYIGLFRKSGKQFTYTVTDLKYLPSI